MKINTTPYDGRVGTDGATATCHRRLASRPTQGVSCFSASLVDNIWFRYTTDFPYPSWVEGSPAYREWV